MSLGDHVVDEELRHAREDDAREAIDEQDRDSDEQTTPRAPYNVAGVAQNRADGGAVKLLFRGSFGHRAIVDRDTCAEWIGTCLVADLDQSVRGRSHGSTSMTLVNSLCAEISIFEGLAEPTGAVVERSAIRGKKGLCK